MEDRGLKDGVRSYVIVPLVVRSTAIGTLAVASVKPNQYSEADAEFLRDAASQIALAIENMKAYQEIAALKARLEHENVYLQEEIHREHNFVEMVGSSLALRVDVRVIAAPHRDLAEAVRAGRFRADLFYRLNVFPIEVPPLRERRTDIPQLATFFVSRFARKFGKRVEAVSKETLDRLMAYPWPGNIRELQNVIERAVVLSSGPSLELGSELLPASAPLDADGARARPESASPAPPAPASLGLDAALEAVERSHILAALEGAGWVIEGARGAAKILKLHPNTLRSRMEKLRIRRRSDEPFGPSASS